MNEFSAFKDIKKSLICILAENSFTLHLFLPVIAFDKNSQLFQSRTILSEKWLKDEHLQKLIKLTLACDGLKYF